MFVGQLRLASIEPGAVAREQRGQADLLLSSSVQSARVLGGGGTSSPSQLSDYRKGRSITLCSCDRAAEGEDALGAVFCRQVDCPDVCDAAALSFLYAPQSVPLKTMAPEPEPNQAPPGLLNDEMPSSSLLNLHRRGLGAITICLSITSSTNAAKLGTKSLRGHSKTAAPGDGSA